MSLPRQSPNIPASQPPPPRPAAERARSPGAEEAHLSVAAGAVQRVDAADVVAFAFDDVAAAAAAAMVVHAEDVGDLDSRHRWHRW